jgi:lipid-A-disaccharide synthase
LPFESELLESAGVNAPYFGHPVVNRIKNDILDDSGWLALLPGSRVQEISRHVPIFLNSAKKIGRPFKWVKPQSIQMSDYLKLLKAYSGEDFQPSEIVKGLNQIEGASLAIVASGTATLEMALKGIPQVVAYKTSWISYFIAKSLIRVKFISLVNLILKKNAVSELIQHHCKPKYLSRELTKLVNNPRSQDDICMDLKSKLDIGMDPMDMIAKYIIKDA